MDRPVLRPRLQDGIFYCKNQEKRFFSAIFPVAIWGGTSDFGDPSQRIQSAQLLKQEACDTCEGRGFLRRSSK